MLVASLCEPSCGHCQVWREKNVLKPAPGKRRCNCRNEVYHRQIGPGMFQQMTEQVHTLSPTCVVIFYLFFFLERTDMSLGCVFSIFCQLVTLLIPFSLKRRGGGERGGRGGVQFLII